MNTPLKPSCLTAEDINDLNATAASYLGGGGDEVLSAIDIALDGKLVMGGTSPGHVFRDQKGLIGGGDGFVLRYDLTTKKIVSSTRLPGAVTDLEINSKTGEIAVAYGAGVAVLTANAAEVVWSKPLANASRVAVADSGKVAALMSGKVMLFGSTGELMQEWSKGIRSRYFRDIAITDQQGGTVIVSGFKQARRDLQVAFVHSFDFDGGQRWKHYDYSAAQVDAVNLLADTRSERVAFGRDGKLYIACWVNGGIGYSVYCRDPFDLSKKADSKIVKFDKYTDSYNTGKVAMTWYGEYDLETGQLVKGQGLVTRRSDGYGNSLTPDSITAAALPDR